MKKNVTLLLLVFFSLVLVLFARAQGKRLLIDNSIQRMDVGSQYLTYLPEEAEIIQPSEILKGVKDTSFKTFQTAMPWSPSLDKKHWIKLELEITEKLTKYYIIEFLDFKILDIELYMPNNTYNHGYAAFHTGYGKPFSQRYYPHKNFAFDLPHLEPGVYKLYARVAATEKVNLMLELSDRTVFLRYATSEYFLLALFFGMLLLTSVSSFFVYASIREISYVHYGLYVFFVGIYFLCRVGLGFEYLWPNTPEINSWLRPASLFLFTLFYLLYTASFLKIPLVSHNHGKWQGLPGVLFLLCVMSMEAYMNAYDEGFLLSWIPFAFVVYRSFGILKQRTMKEKLVLVGTFIVFSGLAVDLMQKYSVIANSWLSYYAIMIAFTLELLTLTWAMALRIREYIVEQAETQKRINEELEIMVAQRTLQLEAKKEELDLYALKVSTDIKGPLRSIIAATHTGHAEDIAHYKDKFQQIERIARNLDRLVSEMFRISTLDKSLENNMEVSVKRMFDEIVSKNTQMSNWKNVHFTNDLSENDTLTTNPILLYLSLQNMIENAISYPKPGNPQIHIRVYSRTNEKGYQIIVEDDTSGIPPHHLIHVLHEPEVPQGHLGMFVVRNTLQKLGFEMDVFRLKNKGNQFVITA